MEKMKDTIVTLVGALLLLASSRASAVDGVVEINDAKVQAAGGYPYTITEHGSYRLTSNLRVNDANTTAIKVNASDVTIDLNGFSIFGPGGSGFGGGIDAGGQPLITVYNGEVAGMGNFGILTGHSSQIHHVRLFGNLGIGILCADACIISSNVANNNAVYGIQVGGSATGRIVDNITNYNGSNGIFAGGVLSGNVSNHNGGSGFLIGEDAVVTNNHASSNAGVGLSCSAPVAYSNNIFSSNGQGAVAGGCTQTGPNVCDGKLCP